MKIAVISSWPSVHTDFFLRQLLKRYHEVHFVHLAEAGSDPGPFPEGVVGHIVSPKFGVPATGQLARAFALRRLLRQIAPDILHVHSVFVATSWRELPWILTVCAFHPLVLTAWGSDLLTIPDTSSAARWFARRALARAEAVTADSDAVLDAARRLGARSRRLHEFQFGVDTEMFASTADAAGIRQALDLGSGPIVLSPRSLMPLYNQLDVIDAIPRVRRRFPDCLFVFKRRLDHHSEEYEEDMRSRVHELGVEHAVRTIGEINYERMPALLAAAEVVVSVPDSDATSRSVLEAMACGAFPIVSDVPAIREWIGDGANGFIVRRVSGDHISEAIIQALSSEELRADAKRKNRKIIERRASTAAWMEKLEALYGEVAAGSSPDGGQAARSSDA